MQKRKLGLNLTSRCYSLIEEQVSSTTYQRIFCCHGKKTHINVGGKQSWNLVIKFDSLGKFPGNQFDYLGIPFPREYSQESN